MTGIWFAILTSVSKLAVISNVSIIYVMRYLWFFQYAACAEQTADLQNLQQSKAILITKNVGNMKIGISCTIVQENNLMIAQLYIHVYCAPE